MLCLLFKNVEAKVVIVDTPPEKPHFEVYAHFFRQRFTLTLQQEQLSMKVDFFPIFPTFQLYAQNWHLLALECTFKGAQKYFFAQLNMNKDK